MSVFLTCRLVLLGLCVNMDTKFRSTLELPMVEVKCCGILPWMLAIWTVTSMWHLVWIGSNSWNTMTCWRRSSIWAVRQFSFQCHCFVKYIISRRPLLTMKAMPLIANKSHCRCLQPLFRSCNVPCQMNYSCATSSNFGIQTWLGNGFPPRLETTKIALVQHNFYRII